VKIYFIFYLNILNLSFLLLFSDEITNFNKINKNSFKPPVSEEVKDIVRKNFTREIEFYQFCRQRLHKQYLAANLKQLN